MTKVASLVVAIAWGLTLQACFSTSPKSTPSYAVVQTKTRIPSSFRHGRFPSHSLPEHISIPASLLDLRVVVRPRAEMRSGPGVHFALQDNFIELGESVIVFEEVDVWCKVYGTLSNVRGWTHCKTLEKNVLKIGSLTLDPTDLPAVFAIQQIPVIYDYRNQEKRSVRIPKGTRFVLLSRKNNRNLVLIDQTLSVMWVEKGDFQ